MLKTFYAGETMRLKAKDLMHSDSGSVTAGAIVTITVANPDGTQYAQQTAATGESGDDWFVDLAAPASPGEYTVKIVAVKDGATWKGKDSVRVVSF
jgi:hypothetical protein